MTACPKCAGPLEMEVGADFVSNSCALVIVRVCVGRCTDDVYLTNDSYINIQPETRSHQQTP